VLAAPLSVKGQPMKPEKASVTCPKCGHTQLEPVAAYSSSCKKCRQYFRLQDLRRPQAQAAQLRPELRRVRCFTCGTDLDVPATAQSTMCKRCSSHLDLQDYHITSTVSKNFRTKGRFLIDETGCLLNTDSIAGEVVLKGKIRGKMVADVFQIFPTAEIKGSFKTARLLIPSVTHFRWLETISVHTAEIAGELVANLQATSTVVLKSSARFFGNIEAAEMIVENGAIWVGNARVGAPTGVSSADRTDVPALVDPRPARRA
jgi:cytoskeletal protein CcmA (bactofilin family)